MQRLDKCKAIEYFQIKWSTVVSLDTGALNSFMSKNFYVNTMCLHLLPKFTSVQIHSSRTLCFCVHIVYNSTYCRGTWTKVEMCTIVSELHVDIVIDMKDFVE